jgi:endonuclease/exonuclease/phosphatase family metal-dependent hydrolase
MSLQKCPYYVFDNTIGEWKKIEWHKQTHEAGTIPKEHLKIATFNTLFDLYPVAEDVIQSERRFPYHFSHTLPNVDADILVLQEITSHYLGRLLKQQWVREKYKYCTMHSDKVEKDPEDKLKNHVIILSKIPFIESYNGYIGEKNCYRAVPIAIFHYPGTEMEFSICGVHLKAKFAFDQEREEQIDDLMQLFGINERVGEKFQNLYKRLAEYNSGETEIKRTKKGKTIQIPPKRKPTWREFDNVILLGDMNMQQDHEEKFIPIEVIDVWKQLRPDEIGYTNDTLANVMARRMGEKKERVPPPLRLDRILILPRNKHCGQDQVIWEPRSVSMFATEPIPLDDTTEVYASDHYGVVCELALFQH